MKKTTGKRARVRPAPAADEILPEYDFSNAGRNPHASRFANGTMAVVLDADVAAVFPDAKTVNETLRALAKVITKERARRYTNPLIGRGGPPLNRDHLNLDD